MGPNFQIRFQNLKVLISAFFAFSFESWKLGVSLYVGLQRGIHKIKLGLESEYVREIAIDDLDEDDYEDRVDDWILNGVQNMKTMKEQDANEKKPGAATFPGGLEVPAWVNDRLFGYQRTALEASEERNQRSQSVRTSI